MEDGTDETWPTVVSRMKTILMHFLLVSHKINQSNKEERRNCKRKGTVIKLKLDRLKQGNRIQQNSSKASEYICNQKAHIAYRMTRTFFAKCITNNPKQDFQISKVAQGNDFSK